MPIVPVGVSGRRGEGKEGGGKYRFCRQRRARSIRGRWCISSQELAQVVRHCASPVALTAQWSAIRFLELMNVLLPQCGGVCVLERECHRGSAPRGCGLCIDAVTTFEIVAFNGMLVRRVAAMFVGEEVVGQGLKVGPAR